jgi:segregation and condensation protein B
MNQEKRITLYKEASLIEAILFLENEPVSLDQLRKISGLSKDIILQAIKTLDEELKGNEAHGLEIAEIGEGFILSPKQKLWENLKDRYGKKNEKFLSRAALETLSIIAYSQPITRAEIENIRGVSADGMIRLLQKRGLIKEVGKKDSPGKPTQYGTTIEFLKVFRLKSISDLPKLNDIDSKRFE